MFEWHSNLVASEGRARYFPKLTTMALDGDDQQTVETETRRLPSALAFRHHVGMTADAPGATGIAGLFDRGVFREEDAASEGLIAPARAEVHVVDDSVLGGGSRIPTRIPHQRMRPSARARLTAWSRLCTPSFL
jgi:hypothetical protein